MADITRRRTGELLRTLFEILMAAPGSMKAKDALDALANKVKLSDYEAGEYPNGGGRRFDKIVRFATIDTVKAGWLVDDDARRRIPLKPIFFLAPEE